MKAAAKLQKVAEAVAKRVAKAASIHPCQNAHQKNNDQEVPDPTIKSNVDGNEGPILARERPRPRRVQQPMVIEMVEMGPIHKSGRHHNGNVT